MSFVKLTDQDGVEIYVNMDVVRHMFQNDEGYTIIAFCDNESETVVEAPEFILSQLQSRSEVNYMFINN